MTAASARIFLVARASLPVRFVASRLTFLAARRKPCAVFPFPENFYARWRAERNPPPALREIESSPPEILLQAVWRHQRLRRDQLTTLDGRTVRILHPGFLSREGGPDFRGAVVQFGDEPPLTGDVEVDLESTGWRAHGHDKNAAFKNVIRNAAKATCKGVTVALRYKPEGGNHMNSLTRVQNWEERAELATWSVRRLAKLSGISVRVLERYFKEHVGKSPKTWLNNCRQKRAIKLLRAGYSVKEVAGLLGYKHPSHLTNEFKKHWGHSPTINKGF